MNEKDHEYMHYVREFNKFDLYPKHGCPIDVTDPSLLKYYKGNFSYLGRLISPFPTNSTILFFFKLALVLEFFPERVRW